MKLLDFWNLTEYENITYWKCNILPEIADAKDLSHFLFFFFFQKVKRGFQFFNTQPLKNILQKCSEKDFSEIKLF